MNPWPQERIARVLELAREQQLRAHPGGSTPEDGLFLLCSEVLTAMQELIRLQRLVEKQALELRQTNFMP